MKFNLEFFKNKSHLFLSGAAIVVGLGLIYKSYKSYPKWKQYRDSQQQFRLQDKQNSLQKWHNNIDSSSLSNLNHVTTKHYDMDLNIDFKQKKINGKIIYTFQALQNELSVILLDIKCISIKQVAFEQEQEPLQFQIVSDEKHSQNLGDQLVINLSKPQSKGSQFKITIIYETNNPNNQSTALNWLEPEQTLGKQHPYLFTQSEPIFGRTIFPCQDSPSVKATFEASLGVNSKLSAWCSGKLNNNYSHGNKSTFMFDQTIPIPAYLFAIVSGNLESREVGSSRCSVITEPEFIEEACQELEDMETQLQALEDYLTPYVWREYKIVILPPSFPYGGMENPLLTFASPSIIVGDKSQISVVIHEMAHSWSGNLVSCKNWQNFFLNEGLTVFIEHKIIKKLYGEELYQITNLSRDQDLKSHIKNFGESHSFTTLQPQIGHDNPDDAFSLVPYVKGCQFFMHLESQLQVVDKNNEVLFQQFLQSYFQQFQQKSLDLNDFLEFFRKHFTQVLGEAKFQKYYKSIKLITYLTTPGFPPEMDFKSDQINQTKTLVQQFVNETDKFLQGCPANFESFTADQKEIFLQKLIQQAESTQNMKEKVQKLDQALNLNQYLTKYNIGAKWLILSIMINYEPGMSQADEFLGSMGRMKYVRPIYQAFVKSGKKELAIPIYEKHKNFYHTIAAKMAAKDLGLQYN